MKFEEKLKELELLNNKIKSGEMPLEETVLYFEQGMKIAESLEKEITEIERRVEILVNNPLNEEGAEPEFKNFQE
jgi:exodeoxyribonuclease VII small subunit